MRPQDFTRERKDTREDEVVDKVLNSLKDLEGKLKELGLDPELMKLPKDDALEPRKKKNTLALTYGTSRTNWSSTCKAAGL